ncbi:hypothetical protein FA95DRAFT_1486454 [Auriscalpium vulgare]|uniref:Uncharacterized protein n=1 Tax=Auriscalpium vulgare TaxID=40419 RepID=A0ACB8S366_9AGAM|nr:hypothetical protein FA95DRAFT_1486454 [Auriscalpium vulgare]
MLHRTVILYDIPGTACPDKSWSPNVWKVRFALNYKGIAHKTEWIEFPDIAAFAKRVGAAHTAVRHNGDLHYTTPILYDPATQRYISGSMAIVRHLERTYPDTPKLFPEGWEAFIALFDDAWMNKAVLPQLPLMVARTYGQLNEQSKGYFRRTREKTFKSKLEDIATPEKLPLLWTAFRDGLGEFDKFARASGESGVFFTGKQLTYADFIVAGWLVWTKRLWGADSREWQDLQEWHDGRWGKLMNEFAKLECVADSDGLKARFVPCSLLPCIALNEWRA